MNILFLSLIDFSSVKEHNIYADLLREFIRDKHKVYIVSPSEKRKNIATHIIREETAEILKIQIGNIQKTSYFEKGISLLRLQNKLIKGIKEHYGDLKFDLIIYATPPINIYKVIKYIKNRDNAKTYLLLKDIWPQGIVDLGIITKSNPIYFYFRRKEKKIYDISDYIGCMSENNKSYLLKHNKYISPEKIEICPNSIEPKLYVEMTVEEKFSIREKYCIPKDRVVFLYGGNLGRPQGLDFLLDIMEGCKTQKCFFLVVGDGTEYEYIKSRMISMNDDRVRLIKYLPKEQYDEIVSACDVGMVFLSPLFTVPNIPSRMLSYMEAGMPILAATDVCTDLKDIIEGEELGYWCINGNVSSFNDYIEKLLDEERRNYMGARARKYLENNCTSSMCYDIIMRHFI